MRVRVVRVLEYTYDDLERYEKDMMQWTQTSANWGTMIMPSSILVRAYCRRLNYTRGA